MSESEQRIRELLRQARDLEQRAEGLRREAGRLVRAALDAERSVRSKREGPYSKPT